MRARLLASFLIFLTAVSPAAAQGVPLIRDAEIEQVIRDYARPIWEKAGLNPQAVEVHIVNDDSLNAFVAGGQHIFVNTGLLTEVGDPNQLIGVLAHETGHITGGHLARTGEALRNASNIAILSMLAGVAAMIAGGTDAGAAIMSSAGEFAGRNFMAYSRTQESSADQAALKFLEETGNSGRGLIAFLEKLGDQEALLSSNQDPYVRSHPLTRDRVARLRSKAQSSPHWDAEDSPEDIRKLARVKAKIQGYMHPQRTLAKYSADDPSLQARYARAFALYREAFTEKALTQVDGLISDNPDDPYFYELKGQILFEAGRAEEALEPLSKAVDFVPNQALLRILYSQALLATETPENAEKAIHNLKTASRQETDNPSVWHYLAEAYHKSGQPAMSDLATAELYVRTGRTREAVHLAGRASKDLEKGTPSWWRAQDIIYIAKSHMKDSDKKGGPPETPPEKGQ